jgi:transposase
MPRGVELSPQMRSRICELRSIHWSYGRIHRKYPEIPISTIQTTCRRERIRQDNQTRPRIGAPRKLSEQQRDHIYDTIQQNPHVMIPDLLAEVDHVVKKRSIQRLLNEMDMRKWKQRRRAEIKPEHAAARLQWAQTYSHFTPEDWARVK